MLLNCHSRSSNAKCAFVFYWSFLLCAAPRRCTLCVDVFVIAAPPSYLCTLCVDVFVTAAPPSYLCTLCVDVFVTAAPPPYLCTHRYSFNSYPLDGPTCYVEESCPRRQPSQHLQGLVMVTNCIPDYTLLDSYIVGNGGKYRVNLPRAEPGL
jgi:hypothetical protein